MAFQPAPDCVEIILVGEVADQTVINTFEAQMDGGYALADVEALANDIDTWVGAEWLHGMSSSYSYIRTDVRGLNSAIDLAASANANAGPGLRSATTFSNNASLAVSRRSGFTGRGARGRIYLPPPPSDALDDDNHISSDYADAIVGFLDLMDDAIASAGFLPVILHRVEAGVPLVEATVFTLVEWVVVDLVIDSMRRRLPRRGV
jgi:hypothetical protein